MDSERPPVTDFGKAIRALDAAGVRYVVIGGLALTAYGGDYVTRDLDIAYDRRKDNVERLAKCLAPLNPRPRDFPAGLPFLWDASTLRQGANFVLGTTIGPIDVLAECEGMRAFDQLWEASFEMELYGCKVRVASIDDLTAMKRAAGRTKDLGHLIVLEALKKRLEGGAG